MPKSVSYYIMITHATRQYKTPTSPQRKKAKSQDSGNLAYGLDRLTGTEAQLQRQPAGGGTPAAPPPASPPTRAQQCATNAASLKQQAQTRLYDVGRKLISLEAHRLFHPNQAPAANSQDARVAATTEAYFSDSSYELLQVLGGRIYHMANCLRDGRVTISCPSNAPHCSSSGSGFTAAYVGAPYHMVFCSVNPGIRTFTHELAHAVLPEVGITRTITAGEKVNDRAYSHNRLFHFMTTHEALDNAESYARLVDDIYNNRTTNLTPPHNDTTNCAQQRDTLSALARLEKWNDDAVSLLGNLIDFIATQNPASWASLPQNYQQMVTNLFPQHNTVAKLRELRTIYTQLGRSISIDHNINCLSAGSNCPPDRLAANSYGHVTASGLTFQRHRGLTSWFNVCPAWTSLSMEAKTESLYGAFMLGAPSWMFNPLTNSDKHNLVLLAKSLSRDTTPLPQSTNLHDHALRDAQQRNATP